MSAKHDSVSAGTGMVAQDLDVARRVLRIEGSEQARHNLRYH